MARIDSTDGLTRVAIYIRQDQREWLARQAGAGRSLALVVREALDQAMAADRAAQTKARP